MAPKVNPLIANLHDGANFLNHARPPLESNNVYGNRAEN